METNESLLEEYFSEYENVRRRGVTDMFDTQMIANHAGIPEDTVIDIQRHYFKYKEKFSHAPLSRHALAAEMHTYGFVTATYQNLVDLYGDALAYRGEHMRPFATWFAATPFGAVQIFSNEGFQFEGQDDETVDIEAVTRWTIRAHSRQACDLIADEVHEEVMRMHILSVLSGS